MTFITIWQEHQQQLHNFIKTKVADHALAEDLLQEVGIKLYTNILNKTAINNPKSWLFQVTRNTIADYYRKNGAIASFSEQPDLIAPDIQEPCVCDLSGYIIENYLPEKYSKPLYLHAIEQLPAKQIASRLELSLTATKSRILRAKKKLKELISECVDITLNKEGQLVEYQLKNSCELPLALKSEIERLQILL